MAERTLPLPGAATARPHADQATAAAAKRKHRGRAIALGLLPLLAFLALALIVPVLWTVDPAAQDLSGRLAAPVGLGGGWGHPLGTDGLGRDLLARIAVGARQIAAVGRSEREAVLELDEAEQRGRGATRRGGRRSPASA